MSSALYSVRLMWLDGRGDIAACGMHAHLFLAPSILAEIGLEVIQFEPALHCFWCREIHGSPRDMTALEIRMVRQWVEQRAAAARVAIEESTGVVR